MIKLYKRNAKGVPLVWQAEKYGDAIQVEHGIVGKTLLKELIPVTKVKVDELDSRVKAKRKEGYKELGELKDSTSPVEESMDEASLISYLNTYLPKYSTTEEGFVLPMLAKTLEDNKPFEKYGTFIGQYKINGLRCIIGAEKNIDFFNPVTFTYHSRTGEDWTSKMSWMNNILFTKLKTPLIELMVEDGACLDGELYLPGHTVNDINSFVKNPTLPEHYKLQYWCYDICMRDATYNSRCMFLHENTIGPAGYFTYKDSHLANEGQFLVLSDTPITDIVTARETRDEFIRCGFEGLILRNPKEEYQFGKRNGAMFKYKKIDDGVFEIVNIEEDKRGLPIYTLKNDINDELFNCTINLSTKAQRAHIAMKSVLIGTRALVEFRERSGVKQVPFHAKIVNVYV